MAKDNPVSWLSSKAKTGLKEFPSNAAWVLSKAFEPAKPAVESVSGAASDAGDSVGVAAAKVKNRTSRVMDSVVDTLPMVGNDSVESLMRRADEASEEARSA
ncbi:MAG: hypothetical protein H0T12_03425, partial [Actinobacteria bacterium]|nr:hypothetical protein [Actinomycetota bacterium]